MAIPTVVIEGHYLTPNGSAPSAGRLVVRLSHPGSVRDAATGTDEIVAASTRVELAADGGLPAGFALVPNDAITPSGTYYVVEAFVKTPAGYEKVTEKWQLASLPNPVDVGAVPRLGVIPGFTVAPIGPADIQALLAALTHPAGYVPSSESEIWFLLATPDVDAPVVTAFAIEATAASLVVNVTSFVATDAVGVTGYIVTESATPPLANDPGWSASAPATVTASAAGARTFYGYAKDAAGNVSTGLSSTCTITLLDVTAPTVDTFVVPATADSLTVAITSATASDAVGVTHGMITESATAPVAGAAGWVAWTGSGALPAGLATYTTSGAGAKTLRLWARDAAGNVSVALSSACTFAVSQVATPTFLPVAGSYIADQNVALSCATPGATIHYTTDGSTPTDTSPTYSGAIPVTSTTTIKAIAMKTGLTDSAVATAVYTLQCATPTFAPPAGSYLGTQSVTISTTTSGAEIRYTTNGDDPTGASTLYTGPVSVAATGTLKAIAIKAGRTNSAIGSAAYTISAALIPANPSFETDITATTEQTGAWWKVVSGSGSCGRFASVEMTGSYVGRSYSPGGIDAAYLCYKFTKAEIDAGSFLTFDVRVKQAGMTGLGIDVYDGGGNKILTPGAANKNLIRFSGVWGVDADTSTVSPAIGVNETRAVSFNLKTWIEARLDGGKTWADVSKVWIYLTATSTSAQVYADNFR